MTTASGSSGSAIRTRFLDVDGLSIRYAESDHRPVDTLLLSPWPESLFAFDRVWGKLAEHAHLVAVDLPGYGHSVRRYPAELPVLRDLLPATRTPVQVIAGGRDWAVPPVNGYFLADRLPHSKLDILNAGHFTWEDAPDEYAELVISWWREPVNHLS